MYYLTKQIRMVISKINSFGLRLFFVIPATIKNLNPREIKQIKKNMNKLKPIMPLVIVKTLNGRGVKPARNSVRSQI